MFLMAVILPHSCDVSLVCLKDIFDFVLVILYAIIVLKHIFISPLIEIIRATGATIDKFQIDKQNAN